MGSCPRFIPGGIAVGFLPGPGHRLMVREGSSSHRTDVVLREPSYDAVLTRWRGSPYVYLAGYHERDLWRVDVATGQTTKALSIPPDEEGIVTIVALATGDVVLRAGVITWLVEDGEGLRVLAKLGLLPQELGTLGEGRALVAVEENVSDDRDAPLVIHVWVLARELDVVRVLACFEHHDSVVHWEPGRDAQLDRGGARYTFTGVAEALAEVARHEPAPRL